MADSDRITIEAMERRPHTKLTFGTARTTDGALWERGHEMHRYMGDKYLMEEFWERTEERTDE